MGIAEPYKDNIWKLHRVPRLSWTENCNLHQSSVIKQLDPIEELYNLYLEEEDSPRIVEVIEDMNLGLGLKDRPVDLYLKL